MTVSDAPASRAGGPSRADSVIRTASAVRTSAPRNAASRTRSYRHAYRNELLRKCGAERITSRLYHQRAVPAPSRRARSAYSSARSPSTASVKSGSTPSLSSTRSGSGGDSVLGAVTRARAPAPMQSRMRGVTCSIRQAPDECWCQCHPRSRQCAARPHGARAHRHPSE